MSAGVLSWPSESLTAPRATSGDTPIASRVAEGVCCPEWQADPVEANTPSATAKDVPAEEAWERHGEGGWADRCRSGVRRASPGSGRTSSATTGRAGCAAVALPCSGGSGRVGRRRRGRRCRRRSRCRGVVLAPGRRRAGRVAAVFRCGRRARRCPSGRSTCGRRWTAGRRRGVDVDVDLADCLGGVGVCDDPRPSRGDSRRDRHDRPGFVLRQHHCEQRHVGIKRSTERVGVERAGAGDRHE